MKVTIRNYQDADLQQCRQLWRELVERHREVYSDPSIGGDRPEEYFDRHLSAVGANNLWVAVYLSKVVGLAGLVTREAEVEIEPLVVSKAYRGRGVGSQLVETLIAQARQLKIKYINVSPIARNAEAIEFFYKIGFVNIGQIDLFMDLTGKKWQPCLNIHGKNFNY